MDLAFVGAALRRRWPLAAAILVLIPIVMVVYLSGRDVERPPAIYTTSADVLIPASNPDDRGESASVPPVLLQGQIDLALSRSVKDVALQKAGLDPDTSGGIGFSAQLNEDRTIITLTVSAPRPETAASVLDQYVLAHEDGRRQAVLDAAIYRSETDVLTINVLRRRIAVVEDKLAITPPPVVPDGSPVLPPFGASSEAVLLAYERNALYNELQRFQVDYSLQVTRATIPGDYAQLVQLRSAARVTPPPPSPFSTLLSMLGGGLLLALALPVVVDRLDPTITEARAAPGALRARLLGTIPFMPRRLHHGLAAPGSTWDRSFRSLAATSISTDALPKAILVTSPTGSTQDSVAANFAGALASLGVRVALIGTVPRQDWFRDDVYADVDAEDDPIDDDEDDDEDIEDGEDGTGPPAPAAPPRDPDDNVATFAELLEDAQAGLLRGDIRGRLAAKEVGNFFVIPPGHQGHDLALDGLPPLLDALSGSEIDVTVIAGPALLEEPAATIIAWSTRHVLWALELGRVNTRDARLAADRLELAGVEPFGIAIVSRRSLSD